MTRIALLPSLIATLTHGSLVARWHDPRWRRTGGYYALFACLGLSMAITGPTLPNLARQTGSTLGDMGLLFMAGSIGYTLGTLCGGRLFDRVRGHPLLGGAQLAAAACIAAVPLVPWLWLMLAVVFCRGFAEGLVNLGGNTLLLWTHGEKTSPFMNGLHFFFGLGAFVAPLIVARLTAMPSGYRWAYEATAAFIALVGLRVLTMRGSPDPPHHAQATSNAPSAASPLRYGPIVIATLFMFSYVGTEISFGGWVYTYATTLGVVTAVEAAYLTSAFWLAFTVGRLVSIPVGVYLTPRQVVTATLVCCLLLSGSLLVLPPSGSLLWGVTVGLGLCMAPIFPSSYTLTGQLIPLTAFASSLVLLGDGLGCMVLPSLTGKIIEKAGPGLLALTLPLLIFGSLVACLLTFVSLLAVTRRQH